MEGRQRIVIENVRPRVDCGEFPAKAVLGEHLRISANVFTDGHDRVDTRIMYRHDSGEKHETAPMAPVGQDRFEGIIVIDKPGAYHFTIEGWVDHFTTWQEDLQKRVDAGQNVEVELRIGAGLIREAVKNASEADGATLNEIADKLENPDSAALVVSQALGSGLRDLMKACAPHHWATVHETEYTVRVEPPLAAFSAWYEIFPRSFCSSSGEHGSFKACLPRLKDIADMGFDVVYLPPIHPIGTTNRKGKNNDPVAAPDDPGSPWAIGSSEGGHKSIHPDLGTMEDFHDFIQAARDLNLEVALDLAYQCSMDHPYVKDHPEWFKWRPDGTIQYAENPPKKYQDVVPFNFETEDWQALWDELKSIVFFWIDAGVKVFRVDNPHTKPFGFWEWLIRETHKEHPEVVFLSEAFTRPNVLNRLAKIGFSQSYTYFTWRNTKQELVQYMNDLVETEVSDFLRPNFWPNTPDILPEYLQIGGRPAYVIRLVLAATLSSNYGIYGPAYELAVNEAIPGTEEYLASEKYEIRTWDYNRPDSLRQYIADLNQIRRDNAALHQTGNVTFHHVDNDNLLFYVKKTRDLSNVLFIVVNLDPFHTQAGTVQVPMQELGLATNRSYLIYDQLSEDKYIWRGEYNYVELNPHINPVHIFRVHSRMRREADFDYYL